MDLILMKRSLAAGQQYGKWNDLWFEHPNPTLNEPHKAMCWLTPDATLHEDTSQKRSCVAGWLGSTTCSSSRGGFQRL